MRKVMMVVLAASMFLLPGCKASTGTMLGTALGGAVGGIIPAAVGNASPAVQTIAPIAGAAVGAGIGYMIDSNAAEKEEQQAALKQQQVQQYQQAQQQQQQLQQLQQTTRLSAPVVVVTGNNEGVPARNGAELANVLIRLQPGAQFALLTKKANAGVVTQDMVGNGYVALGAPKPQGQNMLITFQKPNAQAAPMSLDQAAKML